jgi:3-hydroxybutyryl-CoA dehydratase
MPEFTAVADLVTQDSINAYADLSGDYNPLHVDPEVAAKSEFGGTIAHGPIALHSFFRSVTTWLGVDAMPDGSEVKVTYRAPTRPGDEVACELREMTTEDGVTAIEADCVTDSGTTVVSIRARIPGAAA